MYSANLLSKTRHFWSNLIELSKLVSLRGDVITNRSYAKKSDEEGCRRALVDIPPKVDPICPKPCERRKPKKPGILHRIKMKMIEGGTNFGTPFRNIQCKEGSVSAVSKKEKVPEQKALRPAKREVPPAPEPRDGVQVSVLGADTAIGQYVALLLKQCPCVKKLRLYEAKDSQSSAFNRSLGNVVHDLHNIDTNCRVQAFSCACCELERCLQNTDIVLMLESGYLNVDMPFEKRFCYQAPIVKHYADCIATECPKAFVIVCASPIDCMVPLVSETMKETGWYDPRKIFGSLAVPEMRSSTLAARALCLEPRYTRVPCVGGTEGDSLVPLFSKAVEYFDFAGHNALLMTEAVRHAPMAVARSDGPCLRAADLSEAHALAGLVIKVAHALLCHDVPRLTGFVETDGAHVISPARFIASTLELNGHGVNKYLGMERMNHLETILVDNAVVELNAKLHMVHDWYVKYRSCSCIVDKFSTNFFTPKSFDRFYDCAVSLYLAVEVLLNDKGICKKLDIPHLNHTELKLLDAAFDRLVYNVTMAHSWYAAARQQECMQCNAASQVFFGSNRYYDRVADCTVQLLT